MAFLRDIFFGDFVDHLKARREAVRSLTVMVAIERWVQMEAAALLDAHRERYGIAGGTNAAPDWRVTCEHQGVDIWLEGPSSAAAIELKAVHNNKNFYAKLAELRNDLTPEMKHVPECGLEIARVGIAVVTYARYTSGSYTTVRSSRRGSIMPREDFLREVKVAAEDDHAWYGGSERLRILELKEITSLDGAPYIEAGLGSAVWLGLAEAKE